MNKAKKNVKPEVSGTAMIRSSAAEYLTFVAASGKGGVEAVYADDKSYAAKRFFATVQNKLHWAIHGQTAAEVICHRADARKERMGLTTWTDAPKGKTTNSTWSLPRTT